MIIDLFGSHSRYARRNAGNALKAELEATEQAGGRYGSMNLSALFSEPVVKAVAPPVSPPVSKPVSPPVRKLGAENQQKNDIGRNVMELLPVAMTRITKVECRGETCTVKKKCA